MLHCTLKLWAEQTHLPLCCSSSGIRSSDEESDACLWCFAAQYPFTWKCLAFSLEKSFSYSSAMWLLLQMYLTKANESLPGRVWKNLTGRLRICYLIYPSFIDWCSLVNIHRAWAAFHSAPELSCLANFFLVSLVPGLYCFSFPQSRLFSHAS